MSLETASYLDSLVVSNPDGTDQRSTADDHLRLIKACLKRSFPQVGGPVSASAQAISYVNDLSASAQAQLNALRDGSATALNAVNARFANSAIVAANIGTIAAANVPNLAGVSNTFVGVIVGASRVAPIVLASTVPGVVFYKTNEAVDAKGWQLFAGAGALIFRTFNDAEAAAYTFMQARRNGNSVATISWSCSDMMVNGFSVLSPPALNGVAAAAYARLDTAQTFAKGAGSTIVTLVDGATITPNCEDGNVFRVALGGNRTMAAPSNPRSGQTIVIHVLQDGTGGRTLAWNAIYRFAGSTDPTLSTAASARDVFAFNYDSVSNVWCQAGLNVG